MYMQALTLLLNLISSYWLEGGYIAMCTKTIICIRICTYIQKHKTRMSVILLCIVDPFFSYVAFSTGSH